MPPPILFGWCFTIAKYTAPAAMASMDPTKTLPAKACHREPLRKDKAAAPENSPEVPAQI